MYPFRTVAAVALLIVGLSALDIFLARTEKAEVEGAAERSWREGSRLLNEGRAEAALDPLRNAHTLVRGNVRYEAGLIEALTALGHTADADPLVEEALQRSPNDGALNLAAARVKAKEGDEKDAEALYHRAIYGDWEGDAAARRRAVRFELAGLLAARNSRQQLLAELIPLEAEAGGEASVNRRIGSLFLAADSPARAAAVYRNLIAKDPDDTEAYAGLGEAEMRLGRYREARAAFIQVAHREAGSVKVAPRLILLNEVIQLDPTPRQLPTAEKFDRSLRLLALAKGDLETRLAEKPSAQTPETGLALKYASDLAAAHPRAVTNELAEQNLDAAQQIWKLRVRLFGDSASPGEEALRLIMERL